jgi:hypothetical protein
VNFDKLTEPGQHILILGPTGVGKTYIIIVFAYAFYNRECIIWRDDSKLDFLNLLPKMKVRAFIPEGATFDYEHPNLEVVEFNPQQIRNTILNVLARKECVNVIVYDRFNWFPERFVLFWNRMFYELWMWKNDPANISQPVTIFVDEFPDLAPARDLALLDSHRMLAARIVFNIRKFRSQGVRFIASAHHYTDLHSGVKGNFMFTIVKRTNRANSLPEEIRDYADKIARLTKTQAFVYAEGYQQEITIPDIGDLAPGKRWKVATKPPHEDVEAASKTDKRFAYLVSIMFDRLHKKGFTLEQIADLLSPYYSGSSAVAQHQYRYPTEEAEAELRKKLKIHV